MLALVLAASLLTAAPTPDDGGEPLPPGAPTDSYELSAWCYGALSEYLTVYEAVQPDLRDIDHRFGTSVVEDKPYSSDMAAARVELKLIGVSVTDAEKASPRPISERGVAAMRQGRSIWSIVEGKTRRELARAWLSWALPDRCDSNAKDLTKRSLLLGKALTYNNGPGALDQAADEPDLSASQGPATEPAADAGPTPTPAPAPSESAYAPPARETPSQAAATPEPTVTQPASEPPPTQTATYAAPAANPPPTEAASPTAEPSLAGSSDTGSASGVTQTQPGPTEPVQTAGAIAPTGPPPAAEAAPSEASSSGSATAASQPAASEPAASPPAALPYPYGPASGPATAAAAPQTPAPNSDQSQEPTL